MRLKSITPLPRTGDHDRWSVVFSHETGDVEKRLLLGGCFVTMHGNDPDAGRREIAYQFLYKAREAERDIACRMFGDEWKKHVAWGPWQDYELKRLKQATDLMNEAN